MANETRLMNQAKRLVAACDEGRVAVSTMYGTMQVWGFELQVHPFSEVFSHNPVAKGQAPDAHDFEEKWFIEYTWSHPSAGDILLPHESVESKDIAYYLSNYLP